MKSYTRYTINRKWEKKTRKKLKKTQNKKSCNR